MVQPLKCLHLLTSKRTVALLEVEVEGPGAGRGTGNEGDSGSYRLSVLHSPICDEQITKWFKPHGNEVLESSVTEPLSVVTLSDSRFQQSDGFMAALYSLPFIYMSLHPTHAKSHTTSTVFLKRSRQMNQL